MWRAVEGETGTATAVAEVPAEVPGSEARKRRKTKEKCGGRGKGEKCRDYNEPIAVIQNAGL